MDSGIIMPTLIPSNALSTSKKPMLVEKKAQLPNTTYITNPIIAIVLVFMSEESL